jgi:hypothetical protein
MIAKVPYLLSASQLAKKLMKRGTDSGAHAPSLAVDG